MLKSYDKAREIAKKYDSNCLANRFNRAVNIVHLDGTNLFFTCAFLKKIEIEDNTFIAVFSEHTGIYIFLKEDLRRCCQYDRSEAEIETIGGESA